MNWGILGFGYMGSKFFQEIERIENTAVTAVASRTHMLSFSSKVHAYTDYDQMLNNGKFDAIYISTTPNTHFEIIKKAIKSEFPIFCEKPLLNSNYEVSLFEKLDIHSYIAENINFMFNQKLVGFLEEIKSGLLGELLEIKILLKRKININARFRIMDNSSSKGALHDFGWYGISFLYTLFQDLSVVGFNLVYDGVNDSSGVIKLKGDNVAFCQVDYSIDLEQGNQVYIKGTKASIKIINFLEGCPKIFLKDSKNSNQYKVIETSSSFGNTIEIVSKEITLGKRKSEFSKITNSLKTSKLVFRIINSHDIA